jgi:hypothetical protein
MMTGNSNLSNQDFAKVCHHPVLGQLIVFLDEWDDGEGLKIIFKPRGLGICQALKPTDGSDEAWRQYQDLMNSETLEQSLNLFLDIAASEVIDYLTSKN